MACLGAERHEKTGSADEDGDNETHGQELSRLEFSLALDVLSPWEVSRLDSQSIT